MPYRFLPISPGTDQENVIAQVNQNFAALDNEAVTKKFSTAPNESLIIGNTGNNTIGMQIVQSGKVAMQVGRYNSTRYGQLFYDANGVPVILIGQAPDDGRMGMWVAKPGNNVLTLLGG